MSYYEVDVLLKRGSTNECAIVKLELGFTYEDFFSYADK